MKGLDNVEYNKTEKLLIRYKSNRELVAERYKEICGISSQVLDGMPKAPYGFSDSTYKKLMKIEKDKTYQRAFQECYIVDKSLKNLKLECENLLKEYYKDLRLSSKDRKLITMSNLNMTERTFERRKSELIYEVNKNLKKIGGKLAENWRKFLKKTW